jgi:hypothetical protein
MTNNRHTAQVRAMQRGLRQLAARGINGRPTGFRPAYSTSELQVGGASSPRIMLTRARLDATQPSTRTRNASPIGTDSSTPQAKPAT